MEFKDSERNTMLKGRMRAWQVKMTLAKYRLSVKNKGFTFMVNPDCPDDTMCQHEQQ